MDNKDIIDPYFYYFSNLCCSNSCSILINDERNIISFGENNYGELGHSYSSFIFPPKNIPLLSNIYMVSIGFRFTVCLDFNGNVYTFGSNEYGKLGINNTNNSYFIEIPQHITLPPIKQISCGSNFTICLSNTGKIYSFGMGESGQLGHGDKCNYNSPKEIINLCNIEYIQCGGNHTICKSTDKIYYGWGSNKNGQIGLDSSYIFTKPTICENWPVDIKYFKCGHSHSLFLDINGNVYACGNNIFGQLGINDCNKDIIPILMPVQHLPEIQQIECGDYHSLCIDINNDLWVFGYNYNGQLGLGDKDNRFKPIRNKNVKKIYQLSSGGNHTFVKTLDDKILAFGDNDHKQLGIKTSSNNQLLPIIVFNNNEYIWNSNIRNMSRQKSANK